MIYNGRIDKAVLISELIDTNTLKDRTGFLKHEKRMHSHPPMYKQHKKYVFDKMKYLTRKTFLVESQEPFLLLAISETEEHKL